MRNSSIKFVTIIFFCGLHLQLSAQYDIWGKVNNSQGERLIGASIFILDANAATTTDFEGYFSLDSLPAGSHEVVVTYLG